MKSKPIIKHIVFTIIALLPLIYLFVMWTKVPAQVPIHFDIRGQPNGYGSKSSMIAVTGLLCGAVLLCYYLLHYLHKIDPRRANKPPAPVMKKIAVVIVIFLTAINFIVLFSSVNSQERVVNKLINPLMGLLFTFLGYYMYNVKPNYFVGIRIPWALASDYNWKKTHQLAGIMWFIGGMVITIPSLFLPVEASGYLLFSVVLIMVLVPSVYSFILFKNRKTTPGYFDKEVDN